MGFNSGFKGLILQLSSVRVHHAGSWDHHLRTCRHWRT